MSDADVMDIQGIGSVAVDAVEAKQDGQSRLQDMILDTLRKAAVCGHVLLPESVLVNEVCAKTGIAFDVARAAIRDLEASQRLVCDQFSAKKNLRMMGSYLKDFYDYESETVRHIRRILSSPGTVDFADADAIVAAQIKKFSFQLTSAQLMAIRAATKTRFFVIAGGPGTGKTTIVNTIIEMFEAKNAKIRLVAPTGRASRRMAKVSPGRKVTTVHRLLSYKSGSGAFERNEEHQLRLNLLIVDEASMLDAQLFYRLLSAVPSGATVILVGDPGQLPSVEPGNVLADVINSGVVTVANLDKFFRQSSSESRIIKSAHRVIRGNMPCVDLVRERLVDFYYLPQWEPDEAADFICDLFKYFIPRTFGFDSIRHMQLLSPMRKGPLGTDNMNLKLQKFLNPYSPELQTGGHVFRLGDRVMQVRNDYHRGVYNGDIGFVVYINARRRMICVRYGGRVIPYSFEELDDLILAYAISIHKSQGSEYPAVVIPVTMQHYSLLDRKLLYTAITRGKKLVIVVGERDALHAAIKNDDANYRYSGLAWRLANAC